MIHKKSSGIQKSYMWVVFHPYHKPNQNTHSNSLWISAIINQVGILLPMLAFIGDDQNGLRCLAIATVFFTVLSILYSYLSIFQGLILHLQLCNNVKRIMKSFDFNEMTCSRIVLENTVKVFNIVRMTSNVLSSQSLILVLNTLIMLICQSYLFMDFALDPTRSMVQ